jgi:hypothetical protein
VNVILMNVMVPRLHYKNNTFRHSVLTHKRVSLRSLPFTALFSSHGRAKCYKTLHLNLNICKWVTAIFGSVQDYLVSFELNPY